MGDTTPIREPQRGLTFEDVWAALMETREQMKETDRKMKETDRRIGDLGNRFGELAEHLVTPNIAGKFRALGYAFTRTNSDAEFSNRDGTPLTEVDVWLENGEFVMAVEVKSRLRKGDVDGHVKRMTILRSYFDERGDARKLLGAVAGAIVPRELKQYVRRKGFYLIEQSGDTVQIDVPRDFTPRIW